MIEAAWLFAAVELNGAVLSRGAHVHLDERECAVELRVIAPALTIEAQRHGTRARVWVTPAQHCSFDEPDQLLRIRLPQHQLATQTLTLGESGNTMSISLLHHPEGLAQSADYAAQAPTRTIPALAVDAVTGSGLHGLGAMWTWGPWSLQALHQRPVASASSTRATGEYFFTGGGHIRAGDFRTDHGPEQRFGEFRGLVITNRAAPLRGDGKAEADLAIQSPSRVQFFDRNGIAVYSSEILPPGNYRVQGFGASTVPGFLEARLVDINGVTQSIALPWSADRKLLSHQLSEWEVFSGEPRAITGGLRPPPLHAARWRYGFHHHVTAGLHVEALHQRHRESIEISTRAIPNTITTAAIGQSCTSGCSTTWLTEARLTLGSRMSTTWSASQTESLTEPGLQRAMQLSLSGSLHPRLSGTVHLSSLRTPLTDAQYAATVSGHLRLDHSTSLVMQARHHVLPQEASRWSGFFGVTMQFGKHNASVSSVASFRSGDATGHPVGVNVQASLGGGTLYGPHLSLAHSQDGAARSDGFFRYASPYGDASLRADSFSRRLNWSAATRLWITDETITFGPVGEDNLVIQQLGAANIRVQHSGRDAQTSNADGIVVFRRAPPWTDTAYSVDAKTLPFGAQLASTRVRIPLASNRAYLVDYRGLWSQVQSWRLSAATLAELTEPIAARDRFGKRVFVAADGFVDITSPAQLPLNIVGAGRTMICTQGLPSRSASVGGQDIALDCSTTPSL